MDFDSELPGPLLRDQSELEEYLCMSEHPLMENYDKFYDKFMSACDGHSTERIVTLIESMYHRKD
jgi:CDP-glycerol glycerophosphotransferase (TagB/SpsB family)